MPIPNTTACGIECPAAECVIFKKCGEEIALYIHDGKIARDCHTKEYLDSLYCSDSCVQDPCMNVDCPAFNRSEVLCFTSSCGCQATWIHTEDRTEVNCETGDVITKDESIPKRNETCT